jgi:transcriptional regulator with XRE-family HTH domain
LTRAADGDLPEHLSRLVAGQIREALARRRISRQKLADDAKISISTLEKALAGSRPFTLGTLVRIEQALGVTLRPAEAPVAQAPEHLGSYSRAATAWLVGDYLTLRPSFEATKAVYGYRTAIAWDDKASCLTFSESERLDAAFTQRGLVAVPNQSGHIHLVTNHFGQHRLITLGLPVITGELYGLLSTLKSGGGHLTPVAAPIVMIPLRTEPEARFGRIAPGDERYEPYKAKLRRAVHEGFIRMLG